MAEREGFEPPIALRLCLISSQVHSTGLCHLSALLTTHWMFQAKAAWQKLLCEEILWLERMCSRLYQFTGEGVRWQWRPPAVGQKRFAPQGWLADAPKENALSGGVSPLRALGHCTAHGLSILRL